MSTNTSDLVKGPPERPFIWSPDPILIDDVGDNKKINVCEIFRFESQLAATMCKEVLKLPPSLYPPDWDKRKFVEDKFKEAALKANILLKPTQTRHDSKDKNTTLSCNVGTCYREKKDWASSQTSIRLGKENSDNCSPDVYKADVRMDRIVNKDKACRDDGRSGSRRTSTQLPLKGNECKFQLILRLKEGQYWYLKYTTKSNAQHNHECVPIEEQDRPMASFTESEREQFAMFSQMVPGGGAQALATKISGSHGISQGQLRHNQKKFEGKAGKKQTQAQEAIDYLRSQCELGQMSYMALLHEVTETSLLAVSKYDIKAKERMAMQDSEIHSVTPTDLELEQAEDVSLSFECSDESGQVTRKSSVTLSNTNELLGLGEALFAIRNDMKVGQKVVLALAWTRTDEKKLFEMFPEVLMVDVTMGTNNQGRPLFVSCCPGPEMEIFTPVRMFLPSQCKWVFDYIFSTVFPTLLGREALARTQLVLSDGDNKIYNAFDANREEHYPRAIHGLCLFHLVRQPMEKAGSNFRCMDQSFCKDQKETFIQWLYTWMTGGGIESEEEYQISLGMLYTWLRSFRNKRSSRNKQIQKINDALEHNSRFMETFLVTKILPHKDRWFIVHRLNRRYLQQTSTSALEGGINQKIKVKSSTPVTPNMNLATSIRTQNQQTDLKMDRLNKSRRAIKDGTMLWSSSPTAPFLTPMGESFSHGLHLQKQNYVHRASCQEAKTIETVRLDQKGIFCQECNNEEHGKWIPLPPYCLPD
ncbi:hypothetical protein SEMRO_99_G050830.1 [Seminavis robusta]|uniref:MULE transposase domain-containing protein n=1 Tax=Seminavis robusta TaxID=568900 RepID=A0A9N8DFV9_9STRA|nr:hypothetical protein SEMRO_99_G050830.1 [Seminavis robusta]|eukprot:Sro99_g050830.1 n/a (757) ;mRNA; f:44662-47054